MHLLRMRPSDETPCLLMRDEAMSLSGDPIEPICTPESVTLAYTSTLYVHAYVYQMHYAAQKTEFIDQIYSR